MRIIGGKFKGKSIFFLKSKITRPLKDSVKENIFNIISHSNKFNVDITGSNVLDLYSGIGSFGIECISRGANGITFVERDGHAVETLHKNLEKLSIQDKCKIIRNEIINFLNTKTNEKFNIIFLDPPFMENDYVEELQLIKKTKIFKNNHIVIIHRERKTSDDFTNTIKPLVIKEYGRSKIIFGKF